MSMDITPTIEPRSDQLNADDLLAGPRTVTITQVTAGTAEQPVNVHLAEYPGRPFKPSKSMRRVMVAVWGPDAAGYVGQRLTLYRDPDVTFGRDKVGGIRISHMTGISEPRTISLTVTRGKRRPHTVQPLTEGGPTVADVQACDSVDALRAMWEQASPAVREAITGRHHELTTLAVDVEEVE